MDQQKLFRILLLIVIVSVPVFSFKNKPVIFDGHTTLVIGATAPDFSLPGVDGKIYSLASFKNAPILLSFLPATIVLPRRPMKTG
jgi:hypothetical protein